MRRISTVFAALLFASFSAEAAPSHTFKVAKENINSGYVVKKVWLEHYALPKIQLQDITYTGGVVLPVDAIPTDPAKFDIILGKDRKRPFALIRVPAYNADAVSKEIKQLSGFTAAVEEDASQGPAFSYSSAPAAKATATSSPLATGNWYKISVTNTGLYKIDYDLINKMGVNPATINPANIRVFGQGGNMLSENNSIPRANDLTENAVWVNDGGDGKFDNGDYVVFYALGPVSWAKDASNAAFRHKLNLYDDKGYYFVNFDQTGLRINSQTSVPTPNVNVTDFSDHFVHEQDLANMAGFGKQWWGEEYSSAPGKQVSGSVAFDLGNATDSAKFHIVTGARSAGNGTTLRIAVNGNPKATVVYDSPAGQNEDMNQILEKNTDFGMPVNGTTTLNFTYSPSGTNDKAYLDYIEVNVRKALSFSGVQFTFRDLKSIGTGNVAAYQVGNASSNTQVWDVTNPLAPVKMNGVLNGSTYTFSQNADGLHEFAALNGSQLDIPEFVSKTDNQNLHGSGQVDLIIVTHPNYIDASNQLADFHRQQDNMRVIVATTPQVYNEFSSGAKDLSAIRDFARMFYDRASNDTAQMPQYILLMGDASYDPKNRVVNNNDFVPTYESEESHYLVNSFCNDDFFAFLDDNENISNTGIANTLDIGVGRLPLNNVEDATAAVKKITHYKSNAAFGPWRLQDVVVADNEDGAGPHMDDGELMCKTVTNESNIYNHTKVYLDALPTVASPGGARAPQANKVINDQVYKGAFFINYSGHGNTSVWSAKRILTPDDYNAWTNFDHLPFMVTATCDFGRFDQPSYVAAGEQLVLKHNGGVIAMLTTTQLVYQFSNRRMNESFLRAQFTHLPGNKWYRFGDAFRIGKNETYQNIPSLTELINFRKFALLGDPALLPDFPRYTVVTDSIKSTANSELVDTVSALGSYIVYGSVRGDQNEVLTDFNGKLAVAFYDKPKTTNVHVYPNLDKSFQTQNNVIYKGKSTVTNGRFSYTFIAPKDINYDYGKGKLSSYADNGITDAAGADTTFTIGGYSDNPVADNDAPIVRPYIGDSLFKDGGITGANTLLYVSLTDETGINVSGNSVGHDLTAVLDGNIDVPYVLNDYYETEANTYKKGHVYFPLDNLSVGKHTIVVKAWDVNNNSGEGTVNFEVIDGDVVKVQDLINYPNPFTDVTHFFFQHNHPDEELNVEINIYSTAGVLVRKIRQSFTPSNSRSNEITWNGTGDGGAKLPAGVYVYRVNIATATGSKTSAYQKLVLLR